MSYAHGTRRVVLGASLLTAATLLITGCGQDSGDTADEGPTENEDVTLTVATSQPETTPNYYCGVELLKERLEDADIGFTVELYPASQLGPDTERFAAVQAGDIDIDLQGASALSATYEPIGVVDAAYVFDDVDHAFEWIDTASSELFEDFSAETGARIVDGWFFGNRTFTTTDTPIESPDDLEGLAIRFPDSPQFLANAEAMGVTPVTVANEEIYVALQQGIAEGQENPIVATHSQSFDEILKVASLNNHQVGIHWLVVGENTYDKLSDEQSELLDETLHGIRAENRECVEEETNKILDEYRADSSYTVVEEDEVDRAAFTEKAEEFFSTYYDGERLELYESIREMAG
ncbi:TRAP-type C4-dicarboxylate transport system substrate-binding protein [Glaciihabitans tibetensis]|uniref:TRAP-type C4-dicarboxylate transport system substrate-binding protein n=1 Tax=Glaciihabitans tibetensis TaxID=1266600 RepID=A0A2T0VG32_9MICO|nr:TRAP transporter substrate-binding protein DctP [Glaciihabitans tibetensis]PRY69169.1 TRAP-type C4-dicarboxylate transport system substrate-binding protein [Glaciihabitans tibetensis]